MSYIEPDVLAPIRARLLNNRMMREYHGALLQDFESGGRQQGEVFYGNLTPDEFMALPLRTKRKGGLAHTVRPFSRPAAKARGMSEVYRLTFADAYGDAKSHSVFVNSAELDLLGIEY